MNIPKNILYSLLLTSLLMACGVRKAEREVVERESSRSTAQDRGALYTRLEQEAESWTAIKAKLKGRLSMGDKSFSARIQLQAARGKGLRMSVHYLLFEVARVWFTPSEIVFVDLVNGAYARETYPDFSSRLGVKLDYKQIESLIVGAVFSPGEGASMSDIERLQYLPLEGGRHQLGGKVLGAKYAFVLSPKAVLEHILVENARGQLVFDARYESSADRGLPVLSTPSLSEYSIYSSRAGQTSKPQANGRLSLEWQSVEHLTNDGELSLEPIIKSKYERIDLGTIIKAATKAGLSD